MCSFKIIAVTNRALCGANFLEQVRKIAQAGPHGIILREKDLTEAAYMETAGQVLDICGEYGVPCILHSHVHAAKALGCPRIHMPLPLLETCRKEMDGFSEIGVSVHSLEEARRARELKATYLIAGHIFATECKPGIAPRGLEFLKAVCAASELPVYAIGGINPQNAAQVARYGAKGACVMSGFMRAENLSGLMRAMQDSAGHRQSEDFSIKTAKRERISAMTVKDENYETLYQALQGLIRDENDALANLANSAALLFHSMEQINWAGFYLYKENQLILGPFQGKPACIRIALGKGVCGTAAQTGESIVVQDVHQFPGHIACDEESASEIVVPIIKDDRLIGVLDVDSPVKARFTEGDRQGLEGYANILRTHIRWEDLLR